MIHLRYMQKLRAMAAYCSVRLMVVFADFRRVAAVLMVVGSLLFTSACGPSTLSKLHDNLNRTAKALNAAAKTNHAFYEAGTYGAVGSEAAIKIRQKAATVIHDSNEKLIIALNAAKNLTKETFEQGKLGVLKSLAEAAAGLSTGNQAIDVVLASISTLINQSVAIIELFQSVYLPYVIPRIQSWQIAEVSV